MKRIIFLFFVFIPIFAFSIPINEMSKDEIVELWLIDKEELIVCYEDLDNTLEEQKENLRNIQDLNNQLIEKNEIIKELNNQLIEKNEMIIQKDIQLIEKNDIIKEKNEKIKGLYKNKILESPLPKLMVAGQLGVGIDPLVPEFFIHTSVNGKFNFSNWFYVFSDIAFYPRWASFTTGKSFPFFISAGVGFRLNSNF